MTCDLRVSTKVQPIAKALASYCPSLSVSSQEKRKKPGKTRRQLGRGPQLSTCTSRMNVIITLLQVVVAVRGFPLLDPRQETGTSMDSPVYKYITT